jgi:RNA-binding protein FUS
VFKTITYCSGNTSFLQYESVGMCFAGYGDRGDMITQEDTVFVSGMSPAMTEDDIQQHFGAIGVIKVSTPDILSPVLWVLGVK